MKRKSILFAWLLASITTTLISCTKDEPDGNNFIIFTYDDTEYKITGDCDFRNVAELSYVISGKDEASDRLFIMNINRTIEANNTYDIYNASPPYTTAIISIVFLNGEEFTEQSYTADNSNIIGKLTITEKTEERLSGTFFCRMLDGDFTDGQFSVKAKVYE